MDCHFVYFLVCKMDTLSPNSPGMLFMGDEYRWNLRKLLHVIGYLEYLTKQLCVLFFPFHWFDYTNRQFDQWSVQYSSPNTPAYHFFPIQVSLSITCYALYFCHQSKLINHVSSPLLWDNFKSPTRCSKCDILYHKVKRKEKNWYLSRLCIYI